MGRTQNNIRVENGYDQNSYTFYPVLIIGAGESGIAMGCRLKSQLGFDQFKIYDRQSGLGGTWWINRYPGVACDVPTVFYSFSFRPNYTSDSLFPPGSQLIKYFNEVCSHYGIVDKFQLNTDVIEVRWLEEEELWEATIAYMTPGAGDMGFKDRQAYIAENGDRSVYIKREKVRAKAICSCVGGLVEPNGWPSDITGHKSFEGPIFHSARWDYGVDLTEKDVIVVGTGCSAAQFVPRLTKEPFNAKSVTQIMRSPPWVASKQKEPFGREMYSKWAPLLYKRVPGLGRVFRTMIFLGAEFDFWNLIRTNSSTAKSRAKAEADLIAHMKKTVPQKYHEILTPSYGLGYKRRIFDVDWFPSLNDPKIHLTTQPLTSVQPRRVTLGPGRNYPSQKKLDSKAPVDEIQLPADVIILSNGFDITNFIHPLQVYGKGGDELHDVWEERGGPQAYMGTAMDGFPNFFAIFGPNTATGHTSLILTTENMVDMSLKFIKLILDNDVTTVEVKKSAEIEWTTKIQDELKNTVWMSGSCHSYYFTENMWNAVTYPRSMIDFTYRCMFPTWSDWEIVYTRKGVFKQKLRRGLIFTAFTLLLAGVSMYRLSEGMFEGLTDMPGWSVRKSLMTCVDLLG